jgi:hypothetical protein
MTFSVLCHHGCLKPAVIAFLHGEYVFTESSETTFCLSGKLRALNLISDSRRLASSPPAANSFLH